VVYFTTRSEPERWVKDVCFLDRVDGYEEDVLRQSLEAGWDLLPAPERPFRPGDRILLKPNLLSGRRPEKAVSTHPAVVAAVAGFLKDRGARLSLGDGPALESTARAVSSAGYTGLRERFGIDLAAFNHGRDVASRHRRWFPRLHLWEGLRDFDHIVNLPKCKTHTMMTLTLGVKNLFGCVPGTRKAAYHLSAGEDARRFARLMLEIWETVQPTLTVLDGIVAMEGNGPSLGKPRPIGLLAMSANALALDAVVGRLVRLPPERHPIVAEALSAGLPGAALDEVEVRGRTAEEMEIRDFRLPRPADCQWHLPRFLVRRFKKWWTYGPQILEDACTRCGQCRDICPAAAIATNGNQSLKVLSGRCIRCFCCHEVCPSSAIAIRPGAGLRGLEILKGRRD
jgi:uncharacterized protein (DUF362 family)/ferredoxin-like protein FixX